MATEDTQPVGYGVSEGEGVEVRDCVAVQVPVIVEVLDCVGVILAVCDDVDVCVRVDVGELDDDVDGVAPVEIVAEELGVRVAVAVQDTGRCAI